MPSTGSKQVLLECPVKLLNGVLQIQEFMFLCGCDVQSDRRHKNFHNNSISKVNIYHFMRQFCLVKLLNDSNYPRKGVIVKSAGGLTACLGSVRQVTLLNF
jgi:hypothetical protein